MDSSSSSKSTSRIVAFDGRRLDGKAKRFQKTWDENAPFTLAYLKQTVRKKTHITDPAISVQLASILPDDVDEVAKMEDEDDVEVLNARLSMTSPGQVTHIMYNLTQHTTASSSSQTTSSDDDSNTNVAGSSPTVNQNASRSAPKPSILGHHQSTHPNGKARAHAPLEPESLEQVERVLASSHPVPGSSKRSTVVGSTSDMAMDIDVNVEEEDDDQDEHRMSMVDQATESDRDDVRPVKKAKKTKADIDEHSDGPVHPAQKAKAAQSSTSASTSSLVAGKGKRKRPASNNIGEKKLTYKILPNGRPVKRGPGRPSPNVQYVTESEANEILAKMDKRDKNKKRTQKKSKAGMYLLRKIVLRTLQSLETDTGVPIVDQHTLSVLALVCKDTLKIAGPWLYANIRLDSLAQWEHIFGHGAPAGLASYLGRDLVKSVDLILDSSDLKTCNATSLSLALGQFVAPKLYYVRLNLLSPSISDLDSAHKSDLNRLVHSLHALVSAQLIARPSLIGEMQQDERMWAHVVCQSVKMEEAEKEREMVETVMGEIWDEMGPKDRKGKGKAKEGKVEWRHEQEWMWEVTTDTIEPSENEEEDVEMVEGDEIDGTSDEDEEETSDSDGSTE